MFFNNFSKSERKVILFFLLSRVITLFIFHRVISRVISRCFWIAITTRKSTALVYICTVSYVPLYILYVRTVRFPLFYFVRPVRFSLLYHAPVRSSILSHLYVLLYLANRRAENWSHVNATVGCVSSDVGFCISDLVDPTWTIRFICLNFSFFSHRITRLSF